MSRLRSLVTPGRVALILIVGVVVLGGMATVRDHEQTTIKAYFSSTTGLYEGDDVKILGVEVGEVVDIEPEGDKVLVSLQIDADQPVPADARAAIVSPSLVSGRFVQLSPAWDGGPTMEDGTVIKVEQTAVPVSFDQVKQELIDLSTALGPDGRSKGTLNHAVRTIAANLENGNDTRLREALSSLHNAADTLRDGRSDLFTTIDNLNGFTQNLATSDAAVRGFTQELSVASQFLSRNRTQLTSAVRELSRALDATGGFVDDHHTRISTSIKQLNLLSAAIADRSNDLAQVLHEAPHSLIGLFNIIEDQAITGRAVLANADSVADLLCGALLGAGGTAKDCRNALQPLLGLLGLTESPTADTGAGETGGAGGTGEQTAAPGTDLSAAELEQLEELLESLGVGGALDGSLGPVLDPLLGGAR